MAKSNEFRSFGELQTHFQEEEAQREKGLQDEMREALEGKISTFPSGNFKTQIEGLESVTIIRPEPRKGEAVANQLHVIPFWKQGENLRHETLSLNAQGELIGKIPPTLKKQGISSEQICRDILHTIKTIDLDFFTQVEESILPPGDWEVESKGGKSPEKKTPAVVDPKRLAFMRSQEDVLFGFTGMNSGFRGYYGYVFREFLALENARTGNATYFFKFQKPIDVDPSVSRLSPEKRVPEPQRAEILREVWEPIASMSKSRSLEAGAIRLRHPNVTDEEWEEKMRQKMAEVKAKKHIEETFGESEQ